MPSKSSTKSVIRENERVMVFIDGSNLYHVLTQSCGRHDLQFDKFALKLANGRDLKRIYYYNIRQESDTNPNMGVEQQKFLDSMYDTPYVEVRLGIWKHRGDIMVEKVVSGDADFYPALQAVKDVGKHIEVAAFDMNLSGESGRVADVVVKFNKTYFTGLWTTRSQAKSRAAAAARPEVSDEAASPNGEDKAATKAASARRSGTRKAASTTSRTRRTAASGGSGTRTRKPTADRGADRAKSNAPEETRAPAASRGKQETAAQESSGTGMRRPPTRRRVGGTSPTDGNANGTRNGRTTPKPPSLRTSTESKPDTAEAERVGTP